MVMGLFRKKTTRIDVLAKEFPNIRFFDKSKIERNYDRNARWLNFCRGVDDLCRDSERIRFLILFDAKDPRKSRYSIYQDRVVLNAAFDFQSVEFKGEFAKALLEFNQQQI